VKTRSAMALATVAVVLMVGLRFEHASAQETQAEPSPVAPQPVQGSSPQGGTQKAAPIERRASRPSAAPVEPVAGPLTHTQGGVSASDSAQPVNRGGEVGTLRVRTRLVNVAVNVVDVHGAPVGGFEKKDFRLFEDGRPQTIAVFEREATSPLSIVLAIDASETVMTSERLEREAAKRFVRAILREQDELALMDFADTVREVVPFTNQAKRVEQGLGALQHGQETALYDAVYLASKRLAETKQAANGRRVLVVISDGGNSVYDTEYKQAVVEAQRADAMIYSIIIVPIEADAGRNTGGEHALIQMSEDTGGKYYYVAHPADLEPAFQRVSDDLRTQYVLGYYAPAGTGDEAFRRIKVTLDGAVGNGMSLRYRTGYFADAR
jgi:Ca-activated chloride channel family protein